MKITRPATATRLERTGDVLGSGAFAPLGDAKKWFGYHSLRRYFSGHSQWFNLPKAAELGIAVPCFTATRGV
ncbi:MAG: hypothetical protein MUC47_09460 [Candidatus Kapabacteria bacterium]|nr:hypothetical protein [Candidatus Kapabacteria bacterium]